ncbi:Metallo-dependent phosphatase-like protein [Neurospora tetraspora]|uniref:Metallo-dependent phosphatase-like protein n=1 Tax=Neurospora tetraspora TaxID=94610 RepID=A0AAE0J0Z1_9PEZI|nr:Metallo-dependent phosphatase-like protein [Neurospora tetraspora]
MTTSTTSPPDPSASTSTSTSTLPSTIPTRLLLLSDTHIRSRSKNPLPFPVPSIPGGADIVIHAGDITDSSKLSEFSLCLSYLRQLNAPLKLIIAGNHDYTLDLPVYSQRVEAQSKSAGMGQLTLPRRKGLGEVGEAKRLLEEARKDGIFYLEEGTHRFELANGARLVVYASPATPAFGSQGFQYTQEEGHVFDVPPEADVVISHGPPRGVLDVSRLTRTSCGSVELWERVKEVRPRLHVFGHIHEAWGAAVVKWPQALAGGWEGDDGKHKGHKAKGAEMTVLVDRGSVEEGWEDSKEERKQKEERVERIVRDGYYPLKYPEREGAAEQTLFVNAAVPYAPGFVPWLVDVELPRSGMDVDGKGGSTCAEERSGETNTRSRGCMSTTLEQLQIS